MGIYANHGVEYIVKCNNALNTFVKLLFFDPKDTFYISRLHRDFKL